MLDSAAAANTIASAAGKMDDECSNASGNIAAMAAALSSNRADGVAADPNQFLSVSVGCCWAGAEGAKPSVFGCTKGTDALPTGKVGALAAGSGGGSGNGAEPLSATIDVIKASPFRLLAAVSCLGRFSGEGLFGRYVKNCSFGVQDRSRRASPRDASPRQSAGFPSD